MLCCNCLLSCLLSCGTTRLEGGHHCTYACGPGCASIWDGPDPKCIELGGIILISSSRIPRKVSSSLFSYAGALRSFGEKTLKNGASSFLLEVRCGEWINPPGLRFPLASF